MLENIIYNLFLVFFHYWQMWMNISYWISSWFSLSPICGSADCR